MIDAIEPKAKRIYSARHTGWHIGYGSASAYPFDAFTGKIAPPDHYTEAEVKDFWDGAEDGHDEWIRESVM